MMNTNSSEDFNVPSPERVALLKRLQDVVGSVTPHAWAACQICDLESLETLTKQPPMYLSVLSLASDMVRHWGSSPGYESQPSTPKTPSVQTMTASNSGPSPSTEFISKKRKKALDSPDPLPRATNAKKLAEERDNYSCILTGIKMIEVAHIYPHHSMKYKEADLGGKRHKFWNFLGLFWSDNKIKTWQAKVFPQGLTEKGQDHAYNLVSLAPHTHAMWGRGLFALKPILESNDKKTLKVQFFWQEKQIGTFPIMSLTTTPNSTQGLDRSTGVWIHNKDDQKIKSGDYFDFYTDDPVRKPLPSFELLELQWFLHRVQGMAGAVDYEWDHYLYNDSSSDFEETPELAFDDDDVEEFSLLSGEPLSPAKVSNDPFHQEVEGHGAKGSDSIMQEERGYLVHGS